MKNIKHLLTTIIMFYLVLAANAQMVVKDDGRVYIGATPTPNDDLHRVLSLTIQGSGGPYNPGAKLAFGDFGRFEHCGWNVFIGEWSDYDSDILWLHGKKGIRMTSWNGSYVLAEWGCDAESTAHFTIFDGLRADRIAVSSSDENKSEIRDINHALARLSLLHGITFTYQPIDNQFDAVQSSKDPVKGDDALPTAKEKKDTDRYISVSKKRGNGDRRYGLLAEEVSKYFPGLVEKDSLGNQYVNYVEMIPVLISAIQELNNKLKVNGLEIGVEEDIEEYLSLQVDTASGTAMMYATGTAHASVVPEAALYQNTPTPSTSVLRSPTTSRGMPPLPASMSSTSLASCCSPIPSPPRGRDIPSLTVRPSEQGCTSTPSLWTDRLLIPNV